MTLATGARMTACGEETTGARTATIAAAALLAIATAGCIPATSHPARPQATAAGPAPAQARVVEGRVSGTVAYRERIALLPDAVVEVDVLGPDGRSVARQRLATNGLQVPIRFALDYRAPAGTALRVDARILDGRGLRIFALAEPQPLPRAGEAALILIRTAG